MSEAAIGTAGTRTSVANTETAHPTAAIASPRGQRRLALSSAAIGVLLALGACAVGPTYTAPPSTLDPAFVNAGATATRSDAPGADIASFWRGFNDPALSQLVERALAANGDIRVAQARLQEARATLQGADAERMPNIGAVADATRALAPEVQFPGTSRSQRTGTVYDAGFTANWELDFFGRNRRASESAAAQVEASQAGVHAAQTAIAAEVARNYLELRGLQQRYEVARQSLGNQGDAVRLTEARLDAGRGTRLDVARARGLLDSTEATLPALQAAIDRTAYRLATLTAQPLRGVAADLAKPQPLPSLPVTDLAALPIGMPSQLLQRRPDIVAAERQLAAATAAIGVATADLFPRVSLTGLIGLASGRLADLGRGNAQQYSLGAGLTWPLLDFGRVRSRIGASEARAQQSLAVYEQTVLTALEETEGALTQFTRTAQQTERLASAARHAEDAMRLARVRFDAGAVDFLVVIDAERQALSSRDALVQSQVNQATSLVSVYRALGGGWSGYPGPALAQR
jgi:multidrug efflux system outer membrane protein